MHPAGSTAATEVPRIVVADADADIRAFYRKFLIECDVVEASEGRDALTKALVRPPWLVITELRLPLIDGYAFCEILRQDRSTATVPIIVATTETRKKQIARAQQIADVVLHKPIPADRLRKECARLMARSHRFRGALALLSAGAAESMGASATVLRIAAESREIQSPRQSAPNEVSRFTTRNPSRRPPLNSSVHPATECSVTR